MTLPLDYPDERELRWLMIANDIDDTALLEPTPIRVGKVNFLGKQTFDFDAEGERVLIFVEEHDLVAWQPRTGHLASWRGVAFALGEEAIWNPATWFMDGALKVHRAPLDWLRADRDGICIVQPRLAYAMLRHVPRLVVDDPQFGRQIRRWLEPPKPSVEILVEVSAERFAA